MSDDVRDDPRNVIDVYKYWTTDAIKADLRTKHHNFSALITNKHHDFNIGTVIRCANAFCAKEVIIHGRKKYDKRGAVGAHLYTTMKHVRFTDDLDLGDSLVVGIDNLDGAVPIESFEWPKDRHVVMAFGQEQTGLTPDMVARCHHLVYIKQYGSVRSLNVGVAAGIAMYDYCKKTCG
jgi:tRNA G18 (ribose-2'-O)-methylase SpoU